jgi:putative hemagglutinin
MATAMYSGLLMLAVQIDNQNEEEQKAQISESVSNRQIDLKSLVPSMKECRLTIGENGKAVLHADNGTVNVAHELSSAEMARLSQILGNSSLSNESKEMRIAGMVNTIVLSQQASQNYEQRMAEQEGQAQNLQRK